MERKMVSVNQKRGSKQENPNSKTKKKGPLKVVYITNPIKFNATASEFRALVQELTGQDSVLPDSARFAAFQGGSGGRETPKAAAAGEDGGHGADGGIKMEDGVICEGELNENGSGPFGFGPYYDYDETGFCDPLKMVDSFQGLLASGFWNKGDDDEDDDGFKSMLINLGI